MINMTQPLISGGHTSTSSYAEEPMDTSDFPSDREDFYQALAKPRNLDLYITQHRGLLFSMISSELMHMDKQGPFSNCEYEHEGIQYIFDISEAMYQTMASWPTHQQLPDHSPLIEILKAYCRVKQKTQNRCRLLFKRFTTPEQKTSNIIRLTPLTREMADAFNNVLLEDLKRLSIAQITDLRSAIENAGTSHQSIGKSCRTVETYKPFKDYPLHLLYMNFLAQFCDQCAKDNIQAHPKGNIRPNNQGAQLF